MAGVTIVRLERHLFQRGGLFLSAAMNGFYGLKRATGNLPADAPLGSPYAIAHPSPEEPPARLHRVGLAPRAA